MSSLLSAVADRLRTDGWFNPFTMFGTARDRSENTDYERDAWIADETLAALFHQDDLCSRIVSIFPEESLRRGVCWSDPCVDRWAGRVCFRERLIEAATWGRLFGFGAVVLGVDDGRSMRDPIAPGQHNIPWIDAFDRRNMRPETVFQDPNDPRFREPEIFRVTQIDGGMFYVHRSRCLIFGGAPTAKRERFARQFADISILQRIYKIIRDYNGGYSALGNMLSDASQGVLKIQGVLAAIASKRSDDLSQRAQLLELSRSAARVMMLDVGENESYEKIATSFAQVPESIDRLGVRVSAASGIPITKLFGMSPAGLNATGESDARNWYDTLESYQKNDLGPRLLQVCSILSPESSFSFPALWQERDKERADREKTEADTDAIYVTNEIVTPEDVLATDRVRARYPTAQFSPQVPAPTVAAPVQDAPLETPVERLAREMTESEVTMCAHGRPNRCPLCGVERDRKFTPGPDGPIWHVAWTPIAEP